MTMSMEVISMRLCAITLGWLCHCVTSKQAFAKRLTSASVAFVKAVILEEFQRQRPSKEQLALLNWEIFLTSFCSLLLPQLKLDKKPAFSLLKLIQFAQLQNSWIETYQFGPEGNQLLFK